MRIAIMQPTYLPWIGYFDLMDQVDLFVMFDNVQFAKRSWQQRNRIKTPKGLEWLTVPVFVRGRFNQTIQEVAISEPDFWKSHMRAIELNYRRSQYFNNYFPILFSIFEAGHPWCYLVDLNIKLIEWLSECLCIQTRCVRASALGVEGKRSELLASIAEKLGATEYLSSIGSFPYLIQESQEFFNRGIKIFFHNYMHPTYRQLFPPFVAYASAVDIVFNEGPKAIEIIRSGRGRPYSLEDVANQLL